MPCAPRALDVHDMHMARYQDAGKSAELSKAPTFKGVSLSFLKVLGNR